MLFVNKKPDDRTKNTYWFTPMNVLKKKTKNKKNTLKNKFSEVVFLNFWALAAGIGYFWPQIRILREKSDLEPDSQVWKCKSRSKNVKIIVLMRVCFEYDHGVMCFKTYV